MTHARIYVCDDELLIRASLADHLEDQGHEVRAFATGEESGLASTSSLS
jgi:DNA-binding response OmpR family regulator